MSARQAAGAVLPPVAASARRKAMRASAIDAGSFVVEIGPTGVPNIEFL